MKKTDDVSNSIIVFIIGLIILIAVVFFFFDRKPKTERYQEILQELEAQKKDK